jgi:hypothetical protein
VGTRTSTLAVRLVILISIWLLGTATFSLAQDGTTTSPVQGDEVVTSGDPAQEAEQTGEPAEETGPLVVPDVLQLPYVFAKGVLEDAGFAWKVKGKVEGYAVNVVVEQSAAPLTRVLDTGAPTIVLKLAANPAYPERGIPDSESPYKGTAVELEDGSEPVPATAEVPAPEKTDESTSDAPNEAAPADPADTSSATIE